MWPVQYKWDKQSTLRGQALDLCWHETSSGSWGLVLISVWPKWRVLRWPTDDGQAQHCHFACIVSSCSVYCPQGSTVCWEKADVGQDLFSGFTISGYFDIQLQFICSERLLLLFNFFSCFSPFLFLLSGFMILNSHLMFPIPSKCSLVHLHITDSWMGTGNVLESVTILMIKAVQLPCYTALFKLGLSI